MKGKLLIVDDEQEIQAMLSRHFRMMGYEVITAGNGFEGLDVLADTRIDVVISDIMMPEMNGVEFLTRIRAEYPMIRVIMITGYVTLENAMSCMCNQADTCIFKPLNDLGELEGAVESALVHLNRWKQKFRELRGMKPAAVGVNQ